MLLPVMMSLPTNSTVGLLLSGGLDSAVLLGTLLERGCQVQPFYVRSRLSWETAELSAVRQLLAAMASPCLAELVVLDMPADDLYGDHWSVTGRGVPGAETPDAAVFLPGRNALLLIKPAIWCRLHGIEQLAMAVLATNPFGDATPEFFADFQSALCRATGAMVRLSLPFAQMTKRQVMELGRPWPLELTFCCISPVDGLHCGRCNKCAERIEAFRAAGMEDRTHYAGEKEQTRSAFV
jgi:7-cyano-7-deazaguanine synthase